MNKENRERWKTVGYIYAYESYDRLRVYIANPESKKTWGPVKNMSESVTNPIKLENGKQKVYIEIGDVYLEMPGGYYLKVSNLHLDNLLDQISGASLEKGVAENVYFGFSDLYPGETVMLFPNTLLFMAAEDENCRETSLKLCKKTTKFIPGNKYETLSGFLWYLGEYYSCRGNENSYYGSDNFPSNKRQLSKVFSNFLPESKKVSDIFSTCEFVVRSDSVGSFVNDANPSRTLIFTSKSVSLVDTGSSEVILDSQVDDSYENRVKKYVDENKEPYSLGSKKFHYRNLQFLFYLFDLSCEKELSGSKSRITTKTKDMVREILKTNIEYILSKQYDANGSSSRMTSNVDQKNNIRTIINDLIYQKSSRYYLNGRYLVTMIKSLFDIDLEELVGEALKTFTIPKIETFEDYLENIGSYEFRESKYQVNIDFIYCSDDKRKFSVYFPDCAYRKALIDIYNEAINSNGGNIKNFDVDNVGTVKSPVLRYTFRVTLEDLARHFKVGNLNDLPEDIKKDLVSQKIYETVIMTKSNVKINSYNE